MVLYGKMAPYREVSLRVAVERNSAEKKVYNSTAPIVWSKAWLEWMRADPWVVSNLYAS